MHPNPAFRKAETARNLDFARARGFGVVTVAGDPWPLAAHVPFLLSEDGARAEAHLARSNPILRALREGPLPALLAVSGPDGYVSPDWYGDPQQVPTWNYVAVHLRGRLELADPAGLRDHLRAVSAWFEEALPKAPWRLEKMEPEALAKLERSILPVTMQVEQVDGTWKLNQNKPEHARRGAAEAMGGSIGSDLAALAELMRSPPA